MAKKNNTILAIAITVLVLSVLGLILMLTTSFLSIYDDYENYFRIFYNGDTRFRAGDVIINGDASDFPAAVPVLVLIGIITILLGSVYMTILALTKRDCFISNKKAPGPISGALLVFGGLFGFIGMMVFVPFGVDRIEGNSNYDFGFGFVFTLIVFILLLLFGIYLIIVNLPKKKKKRKYKKKIR